MIYIIYYILYIIYYIIYYILYIILYYIILYYIILYHIISYYTILYHIILYYIIIYYIISYYIIYIYIIYIIYIYIYIHTIWVGYPTLHGPDIKPTMLTTMRRVEAIKDLEGAGEANLAERLKEMDGWVGPATWSETGKPGKDRPFTGETGETKFFVDFWWPQKLFDSFDVRMCVMSPIWRVQNWDGVPPKAGHCLKQRLDEGKKGARSDGSGPTGHGSTPIAGCFLWKIRVIDRWFGGTPMT